MKSISLRAMIFLGCYTTGNAQTRTGSIFSGNDNKNPSPAFGGGGIRNSKILSDF